MADNFLNKTGLQYYHDRIKTLFPSKAEFSTLEDKVEELITEGGEPNIIEVVQKNGTALPVTNKTVNVTVPTTVAELSDASDYAQTDDVPTKTSDLTNDGDGVSPYATQAYVQQNGGKIDTISVNGTPQTITNKNVDLNVPTKVSDITNDSGYQTEAEVQALIDAELADITGIDFQIVQTLPATGEHGVIYLVPKTGTTGDIYDEYIWLTPTGAAAHFEKIGTTEVDLTGYWAKTELTAITTAEIDTIIGA